MRWPFSRQCTAFAALPVQKPAGSWPVNPSPTSTGSGADRMQQPPSAADVLAAVAEVLDGEIVPALDGPAQHHARVAASLVAIVERELRLGADAADRERAALAALLGDEASDATDLLSLRRELATRLRAGFADDPDVDPRVWQLLADAVRDDLAIAKPGHDAWEGD